MDTIWTHTNGNLTITATAARRTADRFRVDLILTGPDPSLPHVTWVSEPQRLALSDHEFMNPYRTAAHLSAFLSERDEDRFMEDDDIGWGYDGFADDLREMSLECVVEGRSGIDYQCQWLSETLDRPVALDDLDLIEQEHGFAFVDGDLCIDWCSEEARRLWS